MAQRLRAPAAFPEDPMSSSLATVEMCLPYKHEELSSYCVCCCVPVIPAPVCTEKLVPGAHDRPDLKSDLGVGWVEV